MAIVTELTWFTTAIKNSISEARKVQVQSLKVQVLPNIVVKEHYLPDDVESMKLEVGNQ